MEKRIHSHANTKTGSKNRKSKAASKSVRSTKGLVRARKARTRATATATATATEVATEMAQKRRAPNTPRVSNLQIASAFTRLADLLEIDAANPFRVRAYRNAARLLELHPRSVAEMVEKNESLQELPGIGPDLAGKIAEYVRTGELGVLTELEKKIPKGLSELMRIPSMGPKKVHALHHELGITDLASLKRAASQGKLRELSGFGKKTEAKIIAELEKREGSAGKRWRLADVEPVAEELIQKIKDLPGVQVAVIAGSFRRRQETVGDLDVLVTCKNPSVVTNAFVKFDEVGEVVSHGEKRTTVILRDGLQVDLRIIPKESFGAALYYFTGSKNHSIAVRTIAIEKGLKLNEYGVFREQKNDPQKRRQSGEVQIAGKTETEVLAAVGLPYIEPELRENRGEIEAAQEGRLPRLIEFEDIKGDLHAHTIASDGRNTLEEMAEAARAKGYDYLAITDHSQSLKVAHGLDEKRLMEQLDRIDRLNEKLRGLVILKSAEVDILERGKLDYPDSVLKRLDIRVCSIHSRFGLSREGQTERLIRAMDDRYFNILGHPSGRLIGSREPYDIDLKRVLEAARERGCFVELNSQPERLDVNDSGARLAKELGVKVAISSDAHTAQSLDLLKYGIAQARRGWLEAKDVLNTLPLKDLLKAMRR